MNVPTISRLWFPARVRDRFLCQIVLPILVAHLSIDDGMVQLLLLERFAGWVRQCRQTS